jgi:hypothetical protein
MMIFSFFLVTFFSNSILAQSKETGAIEGKAITDDDENPIPAVAITLSSPKMVGGKKVAVTGVDGKFRFPALLPGVYSIEANLEGFNPQKIEGIKVMVGQTLTVDFKMSLGQITEAISVIGVLPMVDVKDSATAVANLSSDFIANIPNTQNVSAMVNLAPGVTQDSIFGAATTGVQYQIDGVDVSDPELGTAYVFLDYGVVEEVMVSGVGAAAEYDGFTGGVFNTVTKSGGNKFEGMIDSYIQPNSWNSKNTDVDYLTPPTLGFFNVHFSLGGALKQDNLFFFLSTQYERRAQAFTGFPHDSVYTMPRILLKLTWQASKNHRLNTFAHGDLYNGSYRGGGPRVDPEATRDQKSPEFAYNLNHVWTINDRIFLESKGAGFMSYYKLIPKQGYDVPGHFDTVTRRSSVNASAFYHAFRNRFQFNSALNVYSDKLITGSHDLKFGIDAEINPTRTESGYSGGMYYRNADGNPDERWLYEGQNFTATNFRFSSFIQDSWAVTDKIKINPGIRLNYYRGSLKDLGNVFTPKMGIAPRVGITYDLFPDHSTVLKFHYGKFYENIKTAYYTKLAPDSDWSAQYWDNEWITYYTDSWNADKYSLSDSIQMPHMNQWTVGIEREILKDFSIGVSYINRSNHNFIDGVLTNGVFSPVDYTFEGENFTLWKLENPDESKFLITNPKKDEYPIVTFTPERKYQGIQLLANKRFSHRWMVNASYTYGKAEGTDDNDDWNEDFSSGVSLSQYFQEKTCQINSYGRLTIDPTHMIKIQGTFVLPFQIYLSGNFSHITGNTYNRMLEVGYPDIHKYLTFPVDPRGSYRLPDQTRLDIRLEKQVNIKNTRIGLTFDIYNVFNAGTVNAVIQDTSLFEETDGIVDPRAFRAGLRLYLNK